MWGRLRKARRFLEEAEEPYTSALDRVTPSLARDAVIAAMEPGTNRFGANADFVAAAALLAELVHEGRLAVSGTGKKVRVTVRDPTPLGDAEIDDALLTIGTGAFGNKVTRLVSFLPKTHQIVQRLVADGLLREESERKLGMFTVRRYHPTPAAGHDELVARVRSTLLGESLPDERTALLVSVLTVGVHLKRWVPRQSVKEAYRRAEEILERIGEDERAIVAAVTVARDRDGGGDSSGI